MAVCRGAGCFWDMPGAGIRRAEKQGEAVYGIFCDDGGFGARGQSDDPAHCGAHRGAGKRGVAERADFFGAD